jgi:hypothetical protein
MHDVHKEEDGCTTFGYNPMGEIQIAWKLLPETYEYKYTVHTEFFVSVCKVATFR